MKTSPNDFQFDDNKDARVVYISSVTKEYGFKRIFSKKFYWTKPRGTNSLSCSSIQSEDVFFSMIFNLMMTKRMFDSYVCM